MTKRSRAYFSIGLYVLCLLISSAVAAQSDELESLLRKANTIYSSNVEESARLAQQALLRAETESSTPAEAAALVILGRAQKALKQYPEAESTLSRGVSLHVDLGYKSDLVENLILLADAQRFTGKFDEAVENVDLALEILKPIDKPKLVSATYNTKGNVFKTAGDFDGALEQFQASMRYALEYKDREDGDQKPLLRAYKNIAGIHKKLKNISGFIDYTEKRVELLDQKNDVHQLNKAYQDLAIHYSRLNQVQKAIEYNVRSIELTKDLSDKKALIESLIGIANSYEQIDDLSSALKYRKEALQLLEESGEASALAIELKNVSTLQRKLGRYAPALENAKRALNIQEELGNQERIARLLLNISIIYRKLSSYDSALEYSSRLLRLWEASDDVNGIASVSNELALLYVRLKQYENAESSYNRTLSFGSDEINPRYLAAAYRGLAVVKQYWTKYDQALEYANQAELIYQQIDSLDGLEATNRTIGQIYEKLGQPEKAAKTYRKSLEQSQILQNRWAEASALIHIGELTSISNKIEARENLLKAASIAEEISAKSLLEGAYSELMLLEADLGHFKSAYQFSLKAKDVSAEINQEEVTQRIAELQIIRETEKHERQIEILKRQSKINALEFSQQSAELDALTKQKTISSLQLEREKFIRTIIIGFAIAVVLALALLYYRFHFAKQKQVMLNEKNNQIASKNSKLEELNATKDRFFSIIAHDLRGPISSLVSLTEMLEDNFETYSREELKKYIATINDSSRETHKLLDDLLGWAVLQIRNTDPVPRIHFIADICVSVENTLSSVAKNKEIKIENLIDTKIPIYADRNMITTVVRNLLANSVKFSTHGQKIIISAKSDDDLVTVHVKDTGIGMSESDIECLFKIDKKMSKKGTDGEKGTGLGLALCKELVEKNGGSIHVLSEKGIGSDFYFTIPRRRPRSNSFSN